MLWRSSGEASECDVEDVVAARSCVSTVVRVRRRTSDDAGIERGNAEVAKG